MGEHHVRHLVATNEQGEIVGIASETDFRTHLGHDIFERVRDLSLLMDRETPCLQPDALLSEALHSMVEHHWDYVIVSQVKMGKPLGILTERDVPRLLAQYPDHGAAVLLSQAIDHPVLSVHVGTSVPQALEEMTRHRVRHMAVNNDSE